ncbi:Na+/H+ antiporter NhaC [Kushneria sp. TE3]|uniref:Na+/H+ antiporter NhaC n=1 Tax=Kushneria sp. TE3 TaxID=3449832 RepID=UPI003F6831B9
MAFLSRHEGDATSPRAPGMLDALFPIVAVIIMLALSVTLFGADASSGPTQIALIMGAMLAAVVGLKNGHRWAAIEEGINHGIHLSLGAILILLSVGAMIGTWTLGGVVPTMIHYGLEILSPRYFYATACLLCALVSVSVGSSWTVAGTIGIGLIGIANGLGLSTAITAGAIISGGYFGDKMSPLSDTTNLAPASAEAELFAHIRHMLWTTTPSLILALILFLLLGLGGPDQAATPERITDIQQILSDHFTISAWLLLPLLALLVMAWKQMPAFPTIFIGALLGVVFALIFQREAVVGLADTPSLGYAMALLKGSWIALYDGYSAHTGNEAIDALLTNGGMASMLTTVWLILSAMTFGGVIERLGLLERAVSGLLRVARSTSSLILSTLATGLATNVVTGDQYLSVVLPGRIYKAEFQRRRLKPVNLSRALEDSGTITSPLIPWNSCGAYMAATLGVATLSYAPFAFFNLINLGIAILYALIGFRVTRMSDDEAPAREDALPTLSDGQIIDDRYEPASSRP